MEAHRKVVPPLAADSRLGLGLAELVLWGEELGRAASPPLIITLAGDLGAGKTTLAQAICRGFGVGEDVTSPTYSLVHRYSSPRGLVYHLDLYRLKSPDDLTNIGWDDVITESALVLVEWPERAGDRLPADHLPIELDYMEGDPSRRILLAG